MQNYAYLALLFQKGSRHLFYASFLTISELCIQIQKTKILILHLVAMGTIFTKRNIMNDLQTQFEHSMFNSG